MLVCRSPDKYITTSRKLRNKPTGTNHAAAPYFKALYQIPSEPVAHYSLKLFVIEKLNIKKYCIGMNV